MRECTLRNWGENTLVNDAPGEEFSLNNIAIFHRDPPPQVTERKVQNEMITHHDQPNPRTSLSNFHEHKHIC